MERLLSILSEIKPDVDYSTEKSLIDDGILDSFDIISLISELNDYYGVQIGMDDLTPENFNSIDAIYDLISRLQDH